MDVGGNIYAAAGTNTGPPENLAGIYRISPEGRLLGSIPIPEDSVTSWPPSRETGRSGIRRTDR